jgi:hypothetical protein
MPRIKGRTRITLALHVIARLRWVWRQAAAGQTHAQDSLLFRLFVSSKYTQNIQDVAGQRKPPRVECSAVGSGVLRLRRGCLDVPGHTQEEEEQGSLRSAAAAPLQEPFSLAPPLPALEASACAVAALCWTAHLP